MKKILFAAMIMLVMSIHSFADQAMLIKKADAEKASHFLEKGTKIREFCAPCGDKAWTEITADVIEIRNNPSDSEILINDKSIDLAYIYIEKDGKWRNLAMLTGISVSGVSEVLPQNISAKKAESKPEKPPEKSSEKVHRIDKITDDCMEKDGSTAGMSECMNQAYQLWDAELNKIYNQLRTLLKPDAKDALKTSQLEWIKFRDAEFVLSDKIYSELQGTMYIPMRAGDRVEIVRKRTLELGSYIDLLKNQ